MTLLEALDYEIRASWWAHHCSWRIARSFAGWYYACKARRKWGRWVNSRIDKAYAELLASGGQDPESTAESAPRVTP